jgi:hypothetical protein
VQTYAGLIDKLLDRLHVVYVFGMILACCVAYIFYQDNSAGLLKDWQGISLFLRKALVLLGTFVAIGTSCILVSWVHAKVKSYRSSSAT